MFQLNNETMHLLFLYLQGELTPQNKEKLIEWRDHSEENRLFLDELDDPSTFYERWEWFNSIDVEEGLALLKKRQLVREEKEASKSKIIRMAAWGAAKIAAVFLLGWLVYILWPDKPTSATGTAASAKPAKGRPASEEGLIFTDAVYTMSTAKGRTDTVLFSEGSIARLGPSSKLQFPTSFASHTRQVSLSGKGNFEVRHILNDKQLSVQDFRVQVEPSDIMKKAMADSTLTIIAEGTNFTVSAYPDDSVIRTTLFSGKLHIIGRNRNAMLTAGHVYELYANGSSDIKDIAEVAEAQPWEREKEWFEFHQESVNNVLKELSRWKKIVLLNPDAVTGKVSFECPRNLSIDDILKHMTTQLNAHYQHISPDTVWIKAGR